MTPTTVPTIVGGQALRAAGPAGPGGGGSGGGGGGAAARARRSAACAPAARPACRVEQRVRPGVQPRVRQHEQPAAAAARQRDADRDPDRQPRPPRPVRRVDAPPLRRQLRRAAGGWPARSGRGLLARMRSIRSPPVRRGAVRAHEAERQADIHQLQHRQELGRLAWTWRSRSKKPRAASPSRWNVATSGRCRQRHARPRACSAPRRRGWRTARNARGGPAPSARPASRARRLELAASRARSRSRMSPGSGAVAMLRRRASSCSSGAASGQQRLGERAGCRRGRRRRASRAAAEAGRDGGGAAPRRGRARARGRHGRTHGPVGIGAETRAVIGALGDRIVAAVAGSAGMCLRTACRALHLNSARVALPAGIC